MTTDTLAQPGTMTAEDLAALKLGDVSFHAYRGEFFIRATIRVETYSGQRIFTAKEQRLFPQADYWERGRKIVTTGTIGGYADSSFWRGDDHTTGFDMIHGSSVDRTWQTIVSTLRVGDVLSLDFCGDAHSNGVTKPAGIHVDRLTLNVTRGKRIGALSFLVSVQASLDNSARMVRRFG